VPPARGASIGRRAFLWTAGLLLVAPLPAAVGSMVDRFLASRARPRRIVIPPDLQDTVTFADGVIVTRVDGDVRAFSARCTHLGCLINRTADDLLVCPCHGSRFRLDGTVAAGPAARPLEPLAHEVDPKTGALIVHAT
jgi:Rieske Fe-S protein